MKTKNIILLFSIVITLISLPLQAAVHSLDQTGTISLTTGYVNNMSEEWDVTSTVTNQPLKIVYTTSTETRHDYVYIYSVDNSGNATLLRTLTGQQSGSVTTLLPNGKAKILFTSDGAACYSTIYTGLNISFAEDSPSVVSSTMNVTGNTFINGFLGVGTSTATKKFEVWDGIGGKFTFSAAGCTLGDEIAQTLDDTGYKLNVGLKRSYQIVVAGTNKLTLSATENIGIGSYSLPSINGGTNNIGIGASSLYKNISASSNIAIGDLALYSTTSGDYNIAVGTSSLFLTTGGNNLGVGNWALSDNTTGTYNSAFGLEAGSCIATGSASNTPNSNSSYSVFIGPYTKAKADNQTNQIVIGYGAAGNGSNTVTLGNDNIVGTYLKGNVVIGTGSLSVGSDLNVNGAARFNNDVDIIGELMSVADGGLRIGDNNGSGIEYGLYNANGLSMSTFRYDNSSFSYGNNALNISSEGTVGIGISASTDRLTVNGSIHAKEVRVDLTGSLADYVFKPTYNLMPLSQVEQYVKTNSHLPEIPSAVEVSKNGVSVGEMQNKLLQKVEELTLYMIDQQKKIDRQSTQISEQSAKIEEQNAKIEELEKKIK